jgi:hypothetical protein
VTRFLVVSTIEGGSKPKIGEKLFIDISKGEILYGDVRGYGNGVGFVILSVGGNQ